MSDQVLTRTGDAAGCGHIALHDCRPQALPQIRDSLPARYEKLAVSTRIVTRVRLRHKPGRNRLQQIKAQVSAKMLYAYLPSLVPHAKATKLIQPCKCKLHNTAPASSPTAGRVLPTATRVRMRNIPARAFMCVGCPIESPNCSRLPLLLLGSSRNAKHYPAPKSTPAYTGQAISLWKFARCTSALRVAG